MSTTTPVTYTPTDVARLTGVSAQVIARAIRRGDIPAIRVGKRSRIPAAYVEALIVNLRVKSGETT